MMLMVLVNDQLDKSTGGINPLSIADFKRQHSLFDQPTCHTNFFLLHFPMKRLATL